MGEGERIAAKGAQLGSHGYSGSSERAQSERVPEGVEWRGQGETGLRLGFHAPGARWRWAQAQEATWQQASEQFGHVQKFRPAQKPLKNRLNHYYLASISPKPFSFDTRGINKCCKSI